MILIPFEFSRSPVPMPQTNMPLASANGTAIEFDRVTFCLNGRPLLENLTLSISQGETLVLLGRSGSGKTTTLKLINGLLVPSDGEVRVNGRSTASWDPIRLRRSIGYVIQDGGLFPHFTVERNIAIVPRIEGWDSQRIQARVRELLAVVGLGPRAHVTLSQRTLRRSAPAGWRGARAGRRSANPDSRRSLLSPFTRSEMQKEFRALQQRMRKAVVFVTHDLREALLLADRIALMEEGRLVVNLPVDEFSRSHHPLVRAYREAFAGPTEARRTE